MSKSTKSDLKGVSKKAESIKEIIKNGYKYLSMGGILIPILDENGKHEKFEEIH